MALKVKASPMHMYVITVKTLSVHINYPRHFRNATKRMVTVPIYILKLLFQLVLMWCSMKPYTLVLFDRKIH